MGSAVATVAVLLLGLIVAQQAAAGTLRQWVASKFFNAADPNRRPSAPSAGPNPVVGARNAGGAITLAVPVSGPVTSGFGMRTHPISGERKPHYGVDFGAGAGARVSAAAPGKVTWSGPRGGYGMLVEINHGGGWTTRYAHLSRATVSVGATVESGQHIGDVGSTGVSTGPHLHFELRQGGKAVDPAGSMAGVG